MNFDYYNKERWVDPDKFIGTYLGGQVRLSELKSEDEILERKKKLRVDEVLSLTRATRC